MSRLFLIAALAMLLLATVGSIAARSNFLDVYRIYGYDNGSGCWQPILNCATLAAGNAFQVGGPGDPPATVSSGTCVLSLYYYDITFGHVGPVATITLNCLGCQ